MDESKQYQRYKGQFKMECIIKAAASIAAVLTLVFLLFLPCFRISIASSPEEAKQLELLGLKPYKNFSILDEIVHSFQSFSENSGTSTTAMLGKLFSIYQIFAVIGIGVAVGWFIIDCVRLGIGVVNLDNYSLLAYDEIKSRAEIKKRGRTISPLNFFVMGIMFEVCYILFIKVFPVSSESGSYFSQSAGVSGAIALALIFGIASIGLFIYDKILKNKIKTAILKEEYNLESEKADAEKKLNAQ